MLKRTGNKTKPYVQDYERKPRKSLPSQRSSTSQPRTNNARTSEMNSINKSRINTVPSNSTNISNLLSLKRKIKFKPTTRIREYLDPETDRDKIWYTEKEYDEIEALNMKVVKMILDPTKEKTYGKGPDKSQRKVKANNEGKVNIKREDAPAGNSVIIPSTTEKTSGDTPRGLEKLIPEGWYKMIDRRDRAYEAVLLEQERQYRKNICDPDAISKAYRRVSSACTDEAVDSALQDERFIRNQFGPLEPLGMRLSAHRRNNKSKTKKL